MVQTAILVVVLGVMLVEAAVSRRHERALRARGAIEPAGDVYQAMQVVYPACFIVMTAESLVRRRIAAIPLASGASVFAVAKALKAWAILTLGSRWTFRVLVPPRASLITSGPYRYMAHPNYLAVLGELAGMALMMAAPLTGTVALASFGGLLLRRIRVEERALGTPSSSAGR